MALRHAPPAQAKPSAIFNVESAYHIHISWRARVILYNHVVWADLQANVHMECSVVENNLNSVEGTPRYWLNHG